MYYQNTHRIGINAVILIEKQMAFGPQKQNIMAVKLAQHCYSYFMFYYKDKIKPNVIEYPACNKY